MKTIIVLCIWGIACIGSGVCIGYWLFAPSIDIVYDDELPEIGGILMVLAQSSTGAFFFKNTVPSYAANYFSINL